MSKSEPEQVRKIIADTGIALKEELEAGDGEHVASSSRQRRTSDELGKARQKPGLSGMVSSVAPRALQSVPIGHSTQSTPPYGAALYNFGLQRQCARLVEFWLSVLEPSGHLRHAVALSAFVLGL